MTQPQSKIHHRPARRGEFTLQAGKTKAQSLDLQSEFQINYEALNAAIAKVDMLLEFWSQMQRSRAPLTAINDNWLVYKAMKMWPRSER